MDKIKEFVKKIDKNYYLLILISLVVIVPLLSINYFYGHDSLFHFANVEVLSNNFSLFPSVIRGDIAKGFGYGIGIFYQPLAHIITSYINVVVSNLYLSFKIVNFLVVVLASVFMYKFMKKVFKDKSSALVASICYITFPYFLSDLYVRFAYSEMLLFVFVPIVMLGIYNLIYEDKENFYIYFIIGFTGMIYSHIVLSFYFSIIIFIYLLVNVKKLIDNKKIKTLLIACLMVLLLSLPFIVLMLEHMSMGIYNVFLDGGMASRKTVYDQALNISSYFDITKGINIYSYINTFVLGLMVLTGINYKKIFRDDKKRELVLDFILITIILMISATKLFPWNKVSSLFLLIQFPWRLEVFMAFFISVLAGIGILAFEKKNRQIIIVILLLSVIGGANSIIYNTDFGNINSYDNDESTTGIGWNNDYFPVNLVNNYEYYENRSNDIIIVKGNSKAKFKIEDDSAPDLVAEVTFLGKSITVELPRIYYLGYSIKLDTGDKVMALDYYQNNNGFMELSIPKEGKLIVTYEGTDLSKLSYIVGTITLVIGIGCYISIVWKKRFN